MAPNEREKDGPSTHDEAVQQLRAACENKDVERTRALFATTLLTAQDATDCLDSASLHAPLLRCLLENGARAASFGSIRRLKSIEAIKLLTEHGRDVKSEGHLLLQDFVHSREALDWLLDHGVDINKTDTTRLANGFNLGRGVHDNSLKILNAAATKGDIDLFDHLVARGADPARSLALHSASSCQDPERTTAMINHLVQTHHMDIELDNGTLRDFPNGGPEVGTPLVAAIANYNLAATLALLANGADARKGAYLAVGNILFEGGFLAALGPLLDAGADLDSAFRHAIDENNVDAARVCLERGSHPHSAFQQEAAMLEEMEEARAEGELDMTEEEESEVGMSQEMRSILLQWLADHKDPLSQGIET